MERHRTKHISTLEERLAGQARDLRDRAKTMPHGVEREALLRRARQAETASHMSDWLSAPWLASPK